MINRILSVALRAGCAAGVALAVLQVIFTVPIILEAETYETASLSASVIQHAVASDGDARLWLVRDGGNHAEQAAGFLDQIFSDWAPEDGLERTAYTILSNILVGFGFGLILLAAMIFGAKRIDASAGLLWGLGGFAAVALAPALGLAPEIPGSAAANLVDRQIWWIGTAFATGFGLWLIVSRPPPLLKVIGLLLLIVPHAIGAPLADGYASTAPAELAGQFAAASLACGAIFWALLGSGLGWFWERGANANEG